MPPESDPETLALFQLPLESFTDARNELAARLRAEGKREHAAAVKALPKPPASAWAVNQLYWKDRPAFEALLASGRRLIDAQRGGAGGDPLREAIRERRGAVQAALRRAEQLLTSAGHGATPQVLRRVSATLEALASGAGEEPPGVLTRDLQAPGFEALAGLAPPAAPPKAKPDSPGPDAGREDESARAAAAETARLKRLADEAETALAEARQRLEGARRELAEAQRRLDRAQERVEQSERSVAEAEARSAEAARAQHGEPSSS